MQEYINKAEEVLMHTYTRYQIVLDKGDGVYLYDTNEKKYLDFGAGIAVFALGYKNEEFNNALKKQIDKLLHTSNYFYNMPAIQAGNKFLKASGMDKVFFTNSGTEAIEGAVKLARKYYFRKTGIANSEIISMNNSFHGRSMGALSVTGQPKYREAFEPLIGGAVFAEFNNLQDVVSKITDKTCAILLEPIQGEGGLYPAKKEFLQGLRTICDEKDILLIFDEIQCGMGRTGTMFAYQGYEVYPDILTSAKALGCGVPVGAFAATNKVSEAFESGDHGTTYGGNPFVCSAVTKIFEIYENINLLDHVKEISTYLETKLEELKSKYSFIIDKRGKGLMQGLELNHPVKDYIKTAMDKGLILFSAGPNTIRFLPPLIVTKNDIDKMYTILDEILSKVPIK